MAAKVVIVAVPTVLGIASIRVYHVGEASAEGLVTREKLNIYTPLPQSAPTLFVPEKPGVIQNGLTTARETIVPLVQAVTGACVSVKTGSVNLYHAGEDVFYYLKDPPPEFLPRFGTITMAGLLGMFLARKGNRFKRLAVPLGLMGAGASVCYPAQAVSALKVTGKKVYAVGHWSSAAVSSLFTSKPKDSTAEPTQAAALPTPECTASEEVSRTVPETQVETVVASASEETESLPVSEVIPAFVDSDKPSPPDTKQAAEEGSNGVSPAEPTPSLKAETVQSVPVETAAVESAAVESVPVESAPVESAIVESVPVESVPVESVLVESGVVESSAVDSIPVESVPVESAPVESSPVMSVPVESAPVESVPVESAAEDSVPIESVPAPVESAPVESAPVESAPVESAPVESAAVESAAVESVAVESAPEESVPVDSSPVESAPVDLAPVELAAEESSPAELAPMESTPSSEEPSAPQASNEPAGPVVEPAPEPVPSESEAAAEDPPTLPQPAQQDSKGGSSSKPSPAQMDFGQSDPEDDDLYTTRS